jgi:hypothetical protein
MNRTAGAAGALLLTMSLVVPVAASTAAQPTERASTSDPAAAGTFHLSLPAPTGQFPVGVRSDWVLDPGRIDSTTLQPRALPIRVWYPAQHRLVAHPLRTCRPLSRRSSAGTVDSLRAGLRAMRAQRAYVAAFMDCYLVEHPRSFAHCDVPTATSRTDRDNPAFDRGLPLTRGRARNRTVHLAGASPGNPVEQRYAR